MVKKIKKLLFIGGWGFRGKAIAYFASTNLTPVLSRIRERHNFGIRLNWNERCELVPIATPIELALIIDPDLICNRNNPGITFTLIPRLVY
ncbi:MAG: hypothetical protein AB8Z23_01100 [Coxiella-like endosymbiont]|uniref:hypothetical protein n=1 Tax=Coxiella-like endosymbiont TaxID=1592897 RepID=UPI00215B40D1|nr:hypothetical protein [Coxiella-like endosymbiont]UVE59532.1 hypothetical protein LG660_00155 [Coxiella-like endosymbiont]